MRSAQRPNLGSFGSISQSATSALCSCPTSARFQVASKIGLSSRCCRSRIVVTPAYAEPQTRRRQAGFVATDKNLKNVHTLQEPATVHKCPLFPNSGHSDHQKSSEIRVRFRPLAAIQGTAPTNMSTRDTQRANDPRKYRRPHDIPRSRCRHLSSDSKQLSLS